MGLGLCESLQYSQSYIYSTFILTNVEKDQNDQIWICEIIKGQPMFSIRVGRKPFENEYNKNRL